MEQTTRSADDVIGAVSGISDDVPRLDRFIEAAAVVAGARTMSEFEKSHDASDITSGMNMSSDRSRKSLRQMVLSLLAPLQSNNRQIMADAIKSSIAIDERDQVLLVYARCLTQTRGVFDILLGIQRDYGTGPQLTCGAIQNVIKRACAKRVGRRGDSDVGVGCRGL